MSPSGFNDAQKLADAIALARSFKSGKSKVNRTAEDIYEREREMHSQPRERQYVERHKYLRAHPIAEGLVLPSKRVYGDDILENGWKINGIDSRDDSIAKDALDFLSRCDQRSTPTVAQAHTKAAATATTSVMRPAQVLARAADSNMLMTPPNAVLRHIAENADLTDGQQAESDNENQSIDKLAELLNSFSFTEPNNQTESTGSILEAFLELLAGHVNVPQDLEEAKRSCIRASHDDDSNKLKQKQHTPTNLPCLLKEPHKAGNINASTDAMLESSPKIRKLCPRASSFVPSQSSSALSTRDTGASKPDSTLNGHECQTNTHHAFAGALNRVSDNAPEGFWPGSARIVTIPETPSPGIPFWAIVPQHGPGLPDSCSTYESAVESVSRAMITTPSEPMRGLSASKWANMPVDETPEESEFM